MMASDPSQELDLAQRISDVAPRVRRFLGRLTPSSQDTDDLLQDVMERALRYRDSFDPAAGGLEQWLMKIAFRAYLNHRERAKRQPRPTASADSHVATPQPDTTELRDLVGHALQLLTPIEQDIVLRFHQEQQSVADISHALHMPAGTVKSHLHRARRKIATHGTDAGGDE